MVSSLWLFAFGIFGKLAKPLVRRSGTLLQVCEQEEKNILLHH
jgi:hypothetical protein